MFHAELSSHIARPNSDIESGTQMGSPRVASLQISETVGNLKGQRGTQA